MASIRTARAAEGRFVQLSNVAAQDTRLTLEAKGIIYLVLSYPPDWTFTAAWLEEQVPNGTRSVRSALKLLEECGYFRRKRTSHGRGKWEWEQVISDEPLSGTAETAPGSSSNESSSAENSSDENRIDETTRDNTEYPQVSSSERNSLDEDRPDTPKTVDQTRSQHGPSSSVPAPQPPDEQTRPDVERLCARLADRIEGNGSKRPTVTKKWRDSARLMLDRDGRELSKALALIDWCQADEFWRGNVLSMPTFREKYDQLRLKAVAEWKARSGSEPLADRRQQHTDDLFARAAQRMAAREEATR